MEFDLRIYSYNCDNGKIGTLITIYNNIEEANNDTEVSRSKIKESITENKIVTTSKINKTTKEIVPGLTIDLSVTRVKMNYFFTGGIYFDEVNNGFYRRVKK